MWVTFLCLCRIPLDCLISVLLRAVSKINNTVHTLLQIVVITGKFRLLLFSSHDWSIATIRIHPL